MNIHVLPSQKHLAMVDFPFREQEIPLMVTMTESWTGLCWLQHGFHDHRPDIRPPPHVEKSTVRHSGTFVNFHLRVSPVVATAMKIINMCMFIYIFASIWEDAKRFQFYIFRFLLPCHASIVPRRHPPCEITRSCDVMNCGSSFQIC